MIREKSDFQKFSASFWRSDAFWLLTLSFGLLVFRFFYLAFWTPYTLAPDEAQYWHWLQRLDLAFVTKPALTTWLMGISTWLLGDTLPGVRLFSLMSQFAVPLLGFALVRQAHASRSSSWIAFAALTTAPLIAAGGLIMSPDALLLPLWLGALWFVGRALEKNIWRDWLIVGLFVGLGGLAKYTAVLFFPLLGLYLLLYRRDVLRAPQVWIAGLLALALQTPTLYWNAT
ncbi:MAG: hypothetical protein COY40_04625, partial [Alphaproteobacteria bacterium CG_4_10_14_0_8_um_filter_53_9]